MVAVLSWFLVDRAPWGIPGWRWVVMAGAAGALAVWWLRRGLPESPRWLPSKDRWDEAQAVLCTLEANAEPHHNGATEPMPQETTTTQDVPTPPKRQASMWRAPYLRRTVMLVIFNFCQTVGFYGFSNWLPAFMAAHGHGQTGGLLHALPITVVYPLSPLLCLPLAKHFERKWLIVAGALGTSMLGLGFAASSLVWMQVLLGASIVVSNNLMSFAYHAYQAELYPTSIRARAVGFVYAWSRLSTVLTSLMIGFFLGRFGVVGAFGFITANMLIVAGVIAWLGPSSSGRSLEALSPEG
jgi:putative MFS transporter